MQGKTILLGVSGSIAAYKSAYLASLLDKSGADVHVLMTKSAGQFIGALTFETLTKNRCLTDVFDRETPEEVTHIALAKKADALMLAPASADLIARLACGLADDMLTTTALACGCRKFIAPAMNTAMYENPVTQENLQKLARLGYEIIEPAVGNLACGDTGRGKMPEPELLFSYLEQALSREKDLLGRRVLITAGPTQEAIDPVRFITNHSSGKMGYALARAAALRGAEVTLVSGPVSLPAPPFVKLVKVTDAQGMFEAVCEAFPFSQIIIKAAAVADYRPAVVSGDKIKKSEGDLSIPLERTRDILGFLGDHRKKGQVLCGFSMETRDMLEHSREKLEKKHLDMICANNLKVEGAGFQTDTNVLTLISRTEEVSLPMMSKEDAAHEILDRLLAIQTDR